MSSVSDLPYRPCVGIMLINQSGLVWVGQRIPKWDNDASQHRWQMPQGGIDKGENPNEAALRELREETGTDDASIIGETTEWLTYDLPEDAIGKALKGRYRGQKQKWFAMRFNGSDGDFDIAADHGEEPEFDSWKWVDIDHLSDLVVPFKRDVYEQVVAEFRPLTGPHPQDD